MALLAAKKFGNMHPVQTTAFYPSISENSCVKCGKCEKACPIDAISLIKDENNNKKVEIDYDVCLGCGVCAANPITVVSPLDKIEPVDLQRALIIASFGAWPSSLISWKRCNKNIE